MSASLRDLFDLPPLVTVATAAELAGGVSRSTAYRRAQSGEWPSVRDGGRLMVQLVPFARDLLGVDLVGALTRPETSTNVVPFPAPPEPQGDRPAASVAT